MVVVRIDCRVGQGRFCGQCCMATEMVLTVEDVERIRSLGYGLEEFAEVRRGFLRLRNMDGRCVFLDPETRGCRIYGHRPLGCRLYPLIYDVEEDTVALDGFCPRVEEVSVEGSREEALRLFRLFYARAVEAYRLYGSHVMRNV